MNAEDIHRLRVNRVEIVRDLDVKYVLNHLIASFVFDPDDDERIKAEKTNQDRVSKLLNMLEKSSKDNAYVAFRTALIEPYPHLVEKLDATVIPTITESETMNHGVQEDASGKAEILSVEQHREEHSSSGSPAQAASSGSNSNVMMTQSSQKTSTTNYAEVSGKGNFVVLGGNNTTINIGPKKKEHKRFGFLPSWHKK
ncbi:uncharacterized protein LOC102801691 [Saccoglossus kowalevskii]|uniref:Uncharacterized protein LOC102801691 n=1 Tax=Saccoglossus kowalevskii TaxID=10224 RepID=A0ABM0MU08_SACKO|nr:PREDICTED: uncharacterized protein LOC102801691 [Saccoglossus kowalevskii]